MVEVSIVIASFRRNGSLQRTVASVLAQRGIDRAGIEIIVCDLSSHVSEGAVARNLAEDAARAGVPFRYLRDPGGVPTRNAGIEAAAGAFLALTEDGAEADPYWLSRLKECGECYDAQIVIGPVFPRFADAARPDDVRRRRGFAYDQRVPTGRPPQRDGGYGNCLVATALCRAHPDDAAVRGSIEFGAPNFFRLMAQQGVRAVWCADAPVHKAVGPAPADFGGVSLPVLAGRSGPAADDTAGIVRFSAR